MGETANPGNAFNAEIENIPINVIRGIAPCPEDLILFLSAISKFYPVDV